jgi:hypothetical protein
MNRDNPISLKDAREYFNALAAIMGPKPAEARIHQLANEMFNANTKGKLAYTARMGNYALVELYIFKLHEAGHLPVPRAMITRDEAKGVLT